LVPYLFAIYETLLSVWPVSRASPGLVIKINS